MYRTSPDPPMYDYLPGNRTRVVLEAPNTCIEPMHALGGPS